MDENASKISELNSVFKEYVKYNTAFVEALLSILVDEDILEPQHMKELNRRQVSFLARLDQLEAAAIDAVKKNPSLDSGDIRSLLDKLERQDDPTKDE